MSYLFAILFMRFSRQEYGSDLPLSSSLSNQSILKEINPDYSLDGLMLKLKLQYFAHLMRKN